MAQRVVPTLEDKPKDPLEKWQGYFNNTDPTVLPANVLVPPSRNCFIPNKDKIVPRLGKTLLGQPYSKEDVAIGFDNFSFSQQIVGEILEGDETEFDAFANSYNAACKVDDTHYLLFWANASDDLSAQVFEVDLDTKAVTALGTPLVVDTGFASEVACGQLNNTQYIAFWAGSSNDGFTQLFNVDTTTFAVTALSTKTSFETGIMVSPSCVKIDSTHFLNFWSNSLTSNKAQAFSINTGTGAVTVVGSPLTFDAAAGQYNSCGQVDSSHFINFWQGASTVGKVQVFNVNLGTFAVTAVGSPLTFEATNDRFNSCVFVDSSHFINFWQGTSTQGMAGLFTINLSTFAVTALGSPLVFDALASAYISACNLGNGTNRFMAFWREAGTPGKLLSQTFSTNIAGGTVEALGTALNYDNRSSTIFNSCVFMGSLIDGFQLVINFWGGTKADTTVDDAVAIFYTSLAIGDTTLEHGCAGDNRILWVAIRSRNVVGGGDRITGITYNGVAMTQLIKLTEATETTIYLYYLLNPDPGFNDIIVTTSSIDRSLEIAASSYFGAKQVAPTVFSSISGIGSSLSITEVTVDDKSWIVSLFSVYDPSNYSGGITTANEETTILRGGSSNFQLADTDHPISPPASKFMAVNFNASVSAMAIAAVFAPAGGTPDPHNWQTVGHKKRFTNDGGYNMEVRITRTDNGLGDLIEVLLKNPLTNIYQWYPITERANPLEQGTADRYYMDSYFYANLEPNFNQRNSRLVWVNGSKTIFSWRGGVAPIVSMVPGVSLTTTPGTSWAALGMGVPSDLIPAGETQYVVVKGRKYEINSSWDTDTILLSDTEGIEVGDYATAYIAPADAPGVLIPDTNVLPDTYPNIDFCRQNKNYMFYGSFASRQLFMSNNFDRLPTETSVFLSTTPSFTINDLILSSVPTFNGTGTVIFTVSIVTAGTPDTIKVITTKNGVNYATTITIDGDGNITANSAVGHITFKFANSTGHNVGDTWKITATQGIGTFFNLIPPGDEKNPPAWANFFYSLPRVPGQGYIFFLPANFWTMEPQEGDMYVSDQYGQWSIVSTQIAADLQSETISFNSLKQVSAAKAIFPYMVGHMENYLVFVTENKNLEFIGREEFLELPQMNYLSQPVAKDFIAATFEKGSIEYFDKKLFITSPKESAMLVYDNQDGNKYWQPPQIYSENGILSIVDNTLISHSNLRNQTFNLFTGKSDDGGAFTVVMRTAYLSFGERWRMKNSNKSFLEGYMAGLPPLVFKAIQGVNGCAGVFPHEVKPIYCLGKDTAPIGEGNLGAHPLGSDVPGNELNHFNEIFPKYNPILQYYFIAFQLECATKNHTYEVLSMGVNAVESNTGNNSLIPEEEISQV